MRVVGHRWSERSHEIKTFLTRNHVPYRWFDVERDDEGARLVQLADAPTADLPLVLVPDGETLRAPSTLEVAAALGLRTSAERPLYDVCIVGGGPAGLAAAVYAASEGLSTVVVEREAPGGQAGQSASIENYLGFPRGLSGADLAHRALAQVSRFGAELVLARDVVGFEARGPVRAVLLEAAVRSRRARSSSPPASPTAGWRRRGSTTSPGAASTTAPTPARRASARATTSTSSARPTPPARRRSTCALRRSGWCSWSGPASLEDHHVAVPRRADPRRPQRSRCGSAPRSWRRPATATWSGSPSLDRDSGEHARRWRRAGCSSSSAPHRAPTGSGPTCVRDDKGFVVTGGPELTASGTGRALAAGPRPPVRPGDQRARGVRRGRRAAGLDEARRVGRRRGRHVGLPRAPLPGDDLMRVEDLRPLPLFDGSDRRPAGGAARRRRRGRRSSPATCCSARASTPTTGGCWSTARSSWSRSSAARRPSSRTWTSPGRWAGGFRAWDEHGVYLATGRGVEPGPGAAGAGRGAAGPVRRLVPVRRPPDRGRLPDGPLHRVDRPAARGAGHAGHAGGRPRPRDQQPGRGRDPRGRRARARPATTLLVVARPARARARSPPRSSPRSTRCVSRSSPAADVPDPLALADREEELSDVAGPARGRARRGRWRRRSPRPASTSPGASGSRPCSTGPALRARRCEWVASTIAAATLLAEVRESTRRISELVGAVRSYSQMDRASLQRIDVTDGPREHAGDARPQAPRRRHRGARLRRRRAADRGVRRRAQPGVDQPRRQRRRRDGRRRHAAGRHPARRRRRRRRGRRHRAPACRREVAARAFEAFFTTKDVDAAPGSASTSPGASWSSGTTARSRSTPGPATPSCGSACRSPSVTRDPTPDPRLIELVEIREVSTSSTPGRVVELLSGSRQSSTTRWFPSTTRGFRCRPWDDRWHE